MSPTTRRNSETAVYAADFQVRTAPTARKFEVQVAGHLQNDTRMTHVRILLDALEKGRDISSHLSPMNNQRAVFNRANRRGNWAKYKRYMDLMLNKWGFYHFHCLNSRLLAFVYISPIVERAFLIDIVKHDQDWKVEKRLVDIVCENWPNEMILYCCGTGTSKLTEADLLAARKQGLNMPVEVRGKYYLPFNGGLMSDGSGYLRNNMLIAPIVWTAAKFDPVAETKLSSRSPNVMVVGVDPGDPRPIWEVAASQAGAMIAERRRIEGCYT